jgi:phosphatidylglycerophosphatase A
MRLIKKKEIIDEDARIDVISIIFSSLFYIGYFPYASGTLGSMAALLFFLIPYFNDVYVLFIFIISFFIVGIFTSQRMMKRYGEDPSVVIIDEVVGMWLTIFLIKLFHFPFTLNVMVLSFLMFRFFDIMKVQPAKKIEKIYNNGYGIMADDMIAGLYAGISVVILLYFFPKLISF